MMLNDFVTWKSLKKYTKYKHGKLIGKSDDVIINDNHYKTIYAKHKQWADSGVYKAAYEIIMKTKLDSIEGDHLQLIIDGTNIYNKSGVEDIGYGSESRKKRMTKLSVLSDNKSNIIAVISQPVNEKVCIFNGKQSKIHTLQHDINGIIPIVTSLKTDKKITLTGDLGYLMGDQKKQELENDHNVKLVTPFRRNQKKKNTADDKKLLKTRFKVENSIAKIKKFNRISLRRDHSINSFMGFVYLAFICVS